MDDPQEHLLLIDQARELRIKAGQVFSPSHPVDRRNLFAGRIPQLEKLLDAVNRKGGHAAVYGERGVGKTSIVSILTEFVQPMLAHRENCHSDDTFARIWSRAFDGIRYTVKARPTIGFGDAEEVERVATLRSSLPAEPTPDDVVRVLRTITVSLLFVFDEFDQISDRSVARAFAETIKALSDYAVNTTVVVVGIGDSIDALLESHASVERALTQVLMPRMQEAELREIISKSVKELGVTFDADATDRIVRLSQGLPHYVHLLGLHSLRAAVEREIMQSRVATHVTVADVLTGIEAALGDASHSLKDDYHRAVSSPQKRTLFPKILLACALSRADEIGYFAQSDVRDALKGIGVDLQIPAFAAHLNKLCQSDRGTVLQKRGTTRRYRYRFSKPLFQPYVLMRGVKEGLASLDVVIGAEVSTDSKGKKQAKQRQ